MTAGLDFEAAGQLTASLGALTAQIGGLCERMDKETQLRLLANQAIRQVEFAGQIALTAGAGTLQDPNRFGCPSGYMWSVRRLTIQGFTAGTVTAYRDNAAGEPLAVVAGAATIQPLYIGSGEIIVKQMSQLVFGATGITGAVSVWGVADQFESWLFPWYIGAQRDN